MRPRGHTSLSPPPSLPPYVSPSLPPADRAPPPPPLSLNPLSTSRQAPPGSGPSLAAAQAALPLTAGCRRAVAPQFRAQGRPPALCVCVCVCERERERERDRETERETRAKNPRRKCPLRPLTSPAPTTLVSRSFGELSPTMYCEAPTVRLVQGAVAAAAPQWNTAVDRACSSSAPYASTCSAQVSHSETLSSPREFQSDRD